ncbi:SCO family protein [Salinispirillum sp. LH 10-3-1]|uniref:SCO family protein n=1 Tax=Salinispirillum sp. LH 10-3-1 TaxID=2952525 RepID=A0AB38YDT3_9GAMM
MKKSALVLPVLLLLVASVVALTVMQFRPATTTQTPTNSTYSHLGGDFELASLNGPVRLADFEGKAVMLFFGFTNCPDVCPTSMAVMRQVFEALPEQQKERVQGIFISVDPERDDLERLHAYTQFFHPNIVGITGTKEEIDAVTRQYAASYFFEETDSAMGYMVQHTARTYVIDTQGTIVDLVGEDEPYTTLLTKVRSLL